MQYGVFIEDGGPWGGPEQFGPYDAESEEEARELFEIDFMICTGQEPPANYQVKEWQP